MGNSSRIKHGRHVQSVFALLCIAVVSTAKVHGQCTPDQGCSFPSNGNLVILICTSTSFVPFPTIVQAGGAGLCMVSAGETYEWSTRPTDGGNVSYNSELTLFNSIGTERLCYGNDPGGNGAWISWTAPENMAVAIFLTKNGCNTDTSASLLTWRCASCIQLPEVLVPYFGVNELACGTSVRLKDPGGDGYYPNNANGQTILHATGTAVIELQGIHAMENFFDELRIYDGEGATGQVLQTLIGAGFINFSGQPGQSLTVRFNSDGSNFMAGFDIIANYIWGCSVGLEENTDDRWALFPNPSNGNFTLTGASDGETVMLTLIDMQGREIQQITKTGSGHISMNLASNGSLVPGCYVMRITTAHNQNDRLVMIE